MPYIIAIGPSSFAEEDKLPRILLEKAGVIIKDNPYGRRLTEEEIIEHLSGCDGLIAGLEPLNERVITSAAPKLKAIARVGIGVENVDFQAAARHGIKVSNTPEGPINAVAEMTIAALLTLWRCIIPSNQDLHKYEWKKYIGKGVIGSTALIIGYGRIGRRTGELLRALGAHILVYDPYIDPMSCVNGEKYIALEEGLKQADIVSIHASGEQCLITEKEFALMKPGVTLLNSARGTLVSEQALIEAIETGIVSHVWFDTFWQEPYFGRLTKYPQALLTPHIATYTKQCRLDMECTAVRNILRDLNLQIKDSFQ